MGLGLPVELFVEFLQKNLVWAKMTKKWLKMAQKWDFSIFKILSLIFAYNINILLQAPYLGKFFFWSYSW